jgi:hypothetical protein
MDIYKEYNTVEKKESTAGRLQNPQKSAGIKHIHHREFSKRPGKVLLIDNTLP